MAHERIEKMKKETGRITNVELQRKVNMCLNFPSSSCACVVDFFVKLYKQIEELKLFPIKLSWIQCLLLLYRSPACSITCQRLPFNIWLQLFFFCSLFWRCAHSVGLQSIQRNSDIGRCYTGHFLAACWVRPTEFASTSTFIRRPSKFEINSTFNATVELYPFGLTQIKI